MRASSCHQSSIGLSRAWAGMASATRSGKFFYAFPGSRRLARGTEVAPISVENPTDAANHRPIAPRTLPRSIARLPVPDRSVASGPRHAPPNSVPCEPVQPVRVLARQTISASLRERFGFGIPRNRCVRCVVHYLARTASCRLRLIGCGVREQFSASRAGFSSLLGSRMNRNALYELR